MTHYKATCINSILPEMRAYICRQIWCGYLQFVADTDSSFQKPCRYGSDIHLIKWRFFPNNFLC